MGITGGNIIEENHYYSYGLKIAGISSKKLGDSYEGPLKNNFLYNGKELNEEADLNWYDYGYRYYDPQIGRFPQLDPLTFNYPFLTPYQYASCEPIGNVDMDGLEAKEILKNIGSTVGNVAVEAAEHGGVVKELTTAVVKASYKINSTKVAISLILSAGNYMSLANTMASIINSSIVADQVGRLIEKKSLSNHTDYLGSSAFNLKMHGPAPANSESYINLEKPIGVTSDVTGLTEKLAKPFGENNVLKYSRNVGSITTGVSIGYHFLNGDPDGLIRDGAEFVIGKSGAAPYYYGAKLLNEIRNSKSVLAETYMGIWENLMIWVNKMHSLPEEEQNDRNSSYRRYSRNALHYRQVLDMLGEKWMALHGSETK